MAILAFLVAVFFSWMWMNVTSKTKFYEKQGIKFCPDTNSSPIGDLAAFDAFNKAGMGPVPIKAFYTWFMDYKFGNGVVNSFKPEEHGDCIGFNMLGSVQLLISDPDMV